MINKRLINLCTDSKKYIVLNILTKCIDLLCNIGIVYIIASIVSTLYNSKDIKLKSLILYTIVILLARFFSNRYETIFAYKSSQKAKNALREMAFVKLFRLGISYENHMSTGSIVQSVGDGIESLDNYFGKYLPQIVFALFSPVILFVLISQISFASAVALIIGVPLIPVSIIAFMKIAKSVMKKHWNNYSDLGNSFLESLHGLTTLKLFKADELHQNKLNNETEKFRKITMKVLSVQLNSITIMDIIAYGGAGLGCIIALTQMQSGNIDIGQMIIITLLSANFFIPLRLLGSYFHIATTSMAAADKIFELLDIEENNDGDNIEIESIESIKANDLSYSYIDGKEVLNNISFEIEKNQTIAFVGESGSGKSTIAKLLIKVLSTNTGNLKINDIDINRISSASIAKHINLLASDSYIFNTTILENLLMADLNAANDEINDKLKTARLFDFAYNQTEKLNTRVGEGGSMLSGGQKQRLALARSLLSGREVLILDEATSNIDSQSEEMIFDAVNSLKGSKTFVIISHRLANVVNADKIYLLKDGKIVEAGDHNQLISKKGEYYRMHKKQEELENIRKKGAVGEEKRLLGVS